MSPPRMVTSVLLINYFYMIDIIFFSLINDYDNNIPPPRMLTISKDFTILTISPFLTIIPTSDGDIGALSVLPPLPVPSGAGIPPPILPRHLVQSIIMSPLKV